MLLAHTQDGTNTAPHLAVTTAGCHIGGGIITTPTRISKNEPRFQGNSTNEQNENEHFPTNVKILGLNMCGLRSKLNNNIMFEDFVVKHELDILCLSETKTDHIDLTDTKLNGEYTCFVKEKTEGNYRYGGVHGLAMIVKENIATHAQLLTDMQSPYILWVKFSKKAFGLACIIGSAYLPGQESDHKDDEMYVPISEDIFKLRNTYNLPICIVGDLNSRTGELDDSFIIDQNVINSCGLEDIAHDLFAISHTNETCSMFEKRKNRDSTINYYGELLIEFCMVRDMKIVNGRFGTDKERGEFTFNGSSNRNSTIDYCVVTPDLGAHITNFEVLPFDIDLSDYHSPIVLTLHANHPIPNETDTNLESDVDYNPVSTKWCDDKKAEFQSKFDFSKINEANQLLDTLEPNNNVNQGILDDITKKLANISIEAGIETGISKHTTNNNSTTKPKKQNKPWFDHDCHLKRKQYIRIKNRLKRIESNQTEETLKHENKVYKKFINKKRNIYNKKLHKKLRNLRSSNPKEYWNMLNPRKSNANKDIGIKPLYDHFKLLNNVTDQSNVSFDINRISIEGDDALNKDFTYAEIDKLINKLKNNKSCGIDNIVNEFIKYSPSEYKQLMVKLFNLILKSGIMPSSWGMSFISPIYKNKGPKNDPNNYRGISIISCLGKLFSSTINERLSEFVETNKIIGEEQAGFRAGYSTQDHIFTLQSIIDIYLNKYSRKNLYCAFIDYQKAFDLVDRTSLWSKLIDCNINGKLMKLIYNMYQGTKACIKLNNKLSNSFICSIGVRQGDNLSPLLFALYINDFESFLSARYEGLSSLNSLFTDVTSNDELETFLKLFILLYADDTIVMAEGHEELQKALEAVSDYCDLWKLQINVNKTKIIRFTKRKCPNDPANEYVFKLNNERIELVDDYVYLGTTVTYNGKFKKAIEKQVIQAKRALFGLKLKKEKYDLPFDIMLDLFDKMILPILLYGCETWGYEALEKIEAFYRKFLKETLRLNKQTTNCMVYGEAGRKPLSIIVKTRMVCYWHKTVTGTESKLSYKMAYLLRKMHEQDQHTSPWLQNIEQILNACGMRDVWLSPDTSNLIYLKKTIEQRLSDQYIQEWGSQINNMSSCIMYRSLKPYFKQEKYLDLPNRSDRINLCKFRCRNTKIPVVTGGYSNRNSPATPYENRLCQLCDMRAIGDEYHYILVCPALQDHRINYLNEFYIRNPNRDKFNLLFQSNNAQVLSKLAKLCFEIIRRFR